MSNPTRRGFISLPSEFDAKFKAKLRILITLWADARKQKSLALLEPVRYNINTIAQSVATFALYPLQIILSEINQSCVLILSEKKSFNDVSPDIDALINKLIASVQIVPNPLLVENEAPPRIEPVKQSTNVTKRSSRRMSIGIVDDEKAAGRAIAALITEFNFDVKYFETMDDLNAQLVTHRIDLVLLDILMPNVSSTQVFEFAASLKRQNIKVISYSGLFNFDIRLAAVRAGVSDFIVKPSSILGIIEKINRVLNLQKKRAYRVVYIDDQKSMGEFYQTLLEDAECDVFFMDSVEKMFANLEDIHPDLFLLDMNMPDVNGLEAAKMIRQQKPFDFTPIVFLTADEQLETKLAALKGGADDVIGKSTPPALVIQLLLTRLRRSLGVREFVSKDSLTGVLNHGQIMEAAMTSYRLSQRQKSKASIAMLDIDKFKAVNDTFGHAAGDKVLSGLGQLLSRSLRNTDYVGRYGGEEFMIILTGSCPEESQEKMKSLKDAFADIEFIFKNSVFRCTFSVGIADLAENNSLPHAINQADQALYVSKESGRNKVTIYHSDESV